MKCPKLCYLFVASLLLTSIVFWNSIAQAQGAKKSATTRPSANTDKNLIEKDHEKERSEWFLRGRVIPGKSAAALRYQAYQNKLQARANRLKNSLKRATSATLPTTSVGWMPLGPVPLASDGTGSGLQDYHQVSGRATAVAIDPADSSGNTVYIGGAQGGVWKSTNAAASVSSNVTWTPLTDDQATLSVGSIAIQPGNSNPGQSVILVGTGEADNAADSYFGLGILRSADGGNTWSLISTANSGAYSLSGIGGTRMAFSTASGQADLVVAAMAATAEGVVDGALTSNTYRGLYTSNDGGQTWNYDPLFNGGASEATSATSVVYNTAAGLFFAALRYHGFYSSPDGVTWTALANQPGAPGLLSPTACPQSYATTCPIYRGEITVVPGRNEMYVWFISLDSNNNPVDQGIWQSVNGGASWVEMDDSGIINCGDLDGCGVDQGFYNLALLAFPDGPSGTDIYAGAVNLYKCSITPVNTACGDPSFINLTHVYGCDPFGALAHVHPDEHAIAATIPSSSAAELMYFANDGGIYRALNGYSGLTTGSCSGTNQFDDLNQNLGSMTQFVSFSQNPANVDLLLGGTQDNGSPATAAATTSTGWGNVLSGDGGYNAIDGNTGNWFASNPDTGSGTLNIQECASGVNCNDSLFNVVVSSENLGGDDGSFYFPYILDPQSTSSMLVGTCRVWSGPRSGGTFTELSLNFDTLGLGTCAGTEVNTIRALASGGPTNSNGSQVIYATTDGPGPSVSSSPIGGNVWVTTNAAAIVGVSSTFSNVTLNGPGGTSINSSEFPVSSVAIDTSDATGNTAYVTVMGFTGGPGHVWQTTNAGASWTDFSGAGLDAIPDSPANAVVVDPIAHMVYVGTDVGVFQSSTSSLAWTELGPLPGLASSGFLPNVAVTALGIFSAGGQKLLRASTYGRGVWQFNLLAAPDFQIAIANSPLTAFPGQNAVFNGTLTSINGYDNPVDLGCSAGPTSPPNPCTPSPVSVTPTQPGAPFTITAGASVVTDYSFSAQGVGTDLNGTTHTSPLTLHVVNWSMTAPMPSSVNEPRGSASAPVSFQISGQGSFSQTVSLSCSFTPNIPESTCAFTPSASFNLATASPVSASATVTVPAGTTPGPYGVTIQANTSGAPAPLTGTFTADVVPDPTFLLTEASAFPNVKAGSTGTTGTITIASQDQFAGTVNLSCMSAFGADSCSISPTSVNSFPATATLTINGTSFSAGSYQVAVQGTSGALTNSLTIPFNVGDYVITGPSALTSIPGGMVSANLSFAAEDFYIGQVDLACASSALPGAQCTLSPAGPISIGGAPIAVAASFTIPTSATAGTYTFNINSHDVAGEPSHTFPTALTVQNFSVGPITPASQSVGAGQSGVYSFSVAPVGTSFAGPVTLSCSGAPSGATCGFTPNPVALSSGQAAVTMTVPTGATASPGSYNVVVTATSGSLAHSSATSLMIADSFQLAVVQPFPAAADAGSSLSAKISVTPNYSGLIKATCNAAALAATQCILSPANPIAISGTAVTISVLVNTPSNSVPGAYNIGITVADAGGSPSHSITLPFTVAQDYTINNLSSVSQTITAGQSITYNLSVAPVGAAYSKPVTLSCTGSPGFPGACSFSPNPSVLLSGAAAVVMTVTTPASSSALSHPKWKNWWFGVWLIFPAILLFKVRRRRRYLAAMLSGLAVVVSIGTLSCGGGGSNGGTTPPGNTGVPVSYTITVIGSPPSLSQATGAQVTLVIQ